MGRKRRKISKVIRFGIGYPNSNPARLWRLWVQGNEVYLSARLYTKVLKVSLHSKGNWSVKGSGNQVMSVRRPAQIWSGVTRGPGIVYAGGLVRAHLSGHISDDVEGALWFKEPPPKRKRSFTILFANKSISQETLLNSLSPPGEIYGPLPLRSDEQVWLATSEQNMPDDEESDFRAEKDKFEFTFQGEDDGVFDAHAIIARQTPNNEIVFMGIILGKENLSTVRETKNQ